MRQLRVRVLNAHEPQGKLVFCGRATAVALLANARGRRAVASILLDLVRTLESSPRGRDLRPEIYSELGRAESLL